MNCVVCLYKLMLINKGLIIFQDRLFKALSKSICKNSKKMNSFTERQEENHKAAYPLRQF